VYIRIDTPHTKLAPRYSGPHKVLERLNDNVYRIETDHGPDTVSTSRLKSATIEMATVLIALMTYLLQRNEASAVQKKVVRKTHKRVTFNNCVQICG